MRQLLAISFVLVLGAACAPPSRCERGDCEEAPQCTADSDCSGGRCVSGACVAKSDRILDVCFTPAGGTERCAASGALELDFGDVAVAGAASVPVVLRSKGTAAVTVSAITASGEAFGATLPSLPSAIAAGGTLELPLRFSPQLASALEGHLVIDSDDPAVPRVDVHLKGRGIDGCALSATPTEISLGDVGIGTRAEGRATIRNSGTAPCTVSQISLAEGVSTLFSASATATPFVLNAGDTAAVAVAYTPHATSDTGETTLNVLYGNARELAIPVHAHPIAPSRCAIVATPGNAPGTEFLLNFGTVDVSSETVSSIELRNVGGSACALRNARIATALGVDGSAYEIRGTLPSSLAPNTSTTLSIAFHPATTGAFGAPPPGPRTIALFLDTGDTDAFPLGLCAMPGFPTGSAGCAAWTLAGTAAAPTFTVFPTTVDAGQVMVGCRSAEKTITLTNTGNQAVSVTQLSMAPLSSSISVTSAPGPSFTVGAGQKVELKGRFAPTATGTVQATLTITTNIPDGTGGTRTFPVTLKGTGVANASVRETFVQPASAKVDVLWIIDDSGSMSEEQSAIAQNATRFIGRANAAAADYHIGIVTTDMEDPQHTGRLQAPAGKPKFIVPGPSAVSDFAQYVNVGTNGSAYEMGLAAMKAALTPPLVSNLSANAGFLRPDARLAVIVVSDEEDQYFANQAQPTAASYVQFLDEFKGIGRFDETSFSAIVGDPMTSQNPAGGCSGANGTADPGSRYVAVQQATGGKFRSICSTDWGQIADDLANDIFSLPSYVNLTGTPDAASVDVRVNGVQLPSGAWTYQVSSNRVIFLNGNVPAAGSTITVDYRLLCP